MNDETNNITFFYILNTNKCYNITIMVLFNCVRIINFVILKINKNKLKKIFFVNKIW